MVFYCWSYQLYTHVNHKFMIGPSFSKTCTYKPNRIKASQRICKIWYCLFVGLVWAAETIHSNLIPYPSPLSLSFSLCYGSFTKQGLFHVWCHSGIFTFRKFASQFCSLGYNCSFIRTNSSALFTLALHIHHVTFVYLFVYSFHHLNCWIFAVYTNQNCHTHSSLSLSLSLSRVMNIMYMCI